MQFPDALEAEKAFRTPGTDGKAGHNSGVPQTAWSGVHPDQALGLAQSFLFPIPGIARLFGQIDGVNAQAFAGAVVVADQTDVGKPGSLSHSKFVAA